MKAIIDITTTDNLVSLIIKNNDDNMIDWSELTREEQIKLVSNLSRLHVFFSGFIKE